MGLGISEACKAERPGGVNGSRSVKGEEGDQLKPLGRVGYRIRSRSPAPTIGASFAPQ
jgi:hypothetical protein